MRVSPSGVRRGGIAHRLFSSIRISSLRMWILCLYISSPMNPFAALFVASLPGRSGVYLPYRYVSRISALLHTAGRNWIALSHDGSFSRNPGFTLPPRSPSALRVIYIPLPESGSTWIYPLPFGFVSRRRNGHTDLSNSLRTITAFHRRKGRFGIASFLDSTFTMRTHCGLFRNNWRCNATHLRRRRIRAGW